MNPVEVTYTTVEVSIEKPIDNVYIFCENLNEILSKIKMCHLFTNNYNTHLIYGSLYDSLSDLFDALEEEVIGLSNSTPCLEFPKHLINKIIVEKDCDCYTSFKLIVNELYAVLTLKDFQNFVASVAKNGINNTIEEIYSNVNKADYLLNMTVSKTSPTLEVDNLGTVIQTNKESGYPIRTFVNPQV